MDVTPGPRFNGFHLLTGMSLVAFGSGFSVCLFNLDTVDACVAHAQSYVGMFQDMGNHIINWMFAIGRAAFKQ